MDGCAINGFDASTPWLAPLRSARTVVFNSPLVDSLSSGTHGEYSPSPLAGEAADKEVPLPPGEGRVRAWVRGIPYIVTTIFPKCSPRCMRLNASAAFSNGKVVSTTGFNRC